ncbi:MAG TPA: hypothetical protein VFQ53_16725 [Kofleriaceae bacterium]|nr:hypothetical protein [Kofleriaceae bacterium]
MCRWLLVLCLAVATSATVWAQPAPPALVQTTQAWNASVAAERRVSQLAAQRGALNQRYQDELDTIDRLKNQKASWRRDRELRDQMSEANETAKQLAAVTGELGRAQTQLATARRNLVAAIDAELATNPPAARRARLDQARAQVMPQTKSKVHRIVLPDMKIDPLADPEELDQQAAALRDAETALQAQIKGLEVQSSELERIAMIRQQHERTAEMDRREDNSSRRTQPTGGGRTAAESLGDRPSPQSPDSSGPPPSFEMDLSIALAEVIDPSTIDSLNQAQRSGDPARRAAAAKQARDAVVKKLEQLRAKRKQVEDAARKARSK